MNKNAWTNFRPYFEHFKIFSVKITLNSIGRIENQHLRSLVDEYEKRIRHYIPFELVYLGRHGMTGKQPELVYREAEGRLILSVLKGVDYPVLLDQNGKKTDSPGFADYIQQAMNRGTRHMAFIIGGAYGFSESVYKSVPERLSLSTMTLTHQITRLVFMEQLYRAMTLLKGEPYHHF